MTEIPGWFRRAIADGHNVLEALRLQGQPFTDEEAKLATRMWANVLWVVPVDWDEELDAQRLRDGFVRLASQISRWPAPAQLLEYMPRRPERERLARPTMTPDQQLTAKREVAALAKLIKGDSRVPRTDVTEDEVQKAKDQAAAMRGSPRVED